MAKASALANLSTTDGAKTAVKWLGGDGTLAASGTWGGASLALEYKPISPDDSITPGWSVTGVVLSGALEASNFRLAEGEIRVNQSASTVTTSITAIATIIPIRVS